MSNQPKTLPFVLQQHHPPAPFSNPNFHNSLQLAAPSNESVFKYRAIDEQAKPVVQPPVSVDSRVQTLARDDPGARSPGWVVKQVQPVKYEQSGQSLSTMLIASTSPTLFCNINETNLPFTNNVVEGKIVNKFMPYLRCEACNIDCNSKDVFDKHISGKKHKRNLQRINDPHTYAVSNTSLSGQLGGLGGHNLPQVPGVASGPELERKKHQLLTGGAAADSVRFCTICNVACNSQDVFSRHLAGKKHAKQVSLWSLHGGDGPLFAAIQSNSESAWNTGPKKTKVVQSVWCEVCKINCNSSELYVRHISGKKHKRKLAEREITNSNIGGLPSIDLHVGPIEDPGAGPGNIAELQESLCSSAHSQASKEDLEAKRRRVLEGGAPSATVKVCTTCNVVCNGPSVFEAHLTGKKHAALVKKLAEVGLSV